MDSLSITCRRMRRREVLSKGRQLLAAGLAASVAGSFRLSPAVAQTAPPNVVYIVADDLGWKDLGYRDPRIKTPNIDKLAATGARLEQFYVQPMCTPTRAALMTGRYPLRYGLQTGVIPSGGSYGLPTDEHLLPQMLKSAGYRTALVGKWHLGHAKTEYWPTQRGFDHFYGALVGEIDHFNHTSHGVKDWYRNNRPVDEQGFDNTLFGDEAVRLIGNHDEDVPLFLYLAFTAPHTPFQAPHEHLDRYSEIADPQRRTYSAMISAMDDQVGRVVEALERRGMRENTLIVFHSDNGGVVSAMFAGESEVKGPLPASNGPFRDGKGTLYEGGTRVAAFVNWPGKIPAGEVTELVHVVDMYPTLAALAGAKLGKNKPLDGVDVWPTLSKGKLSPLVYNIDPMAGAVRIGDWKLIFREALPPKVELYNLAKDPSEAENVADTHPIKVVQLKNRVLSLANEMAPPLLLAEAVKLTFGAPLVTADPSTVFSVGD
jgi:arylsulfatase A-like enzyme